MTRITEAAKIEKIVDYSFEKNEKSNVLAIHPNLPLIAYLINIQRTPKVQKTWAPGESSLSTSGASMNGSLNSSQVDKNKTVSIRIINYVTRQRCLAKGIYHARPTACAFSVNSVLCSQSEVIKLAVADMLANVYLYDLSYFINELTATRIAIIRAPGHNLNPYDNITMVWCPFVPCDDFEDGDGGLRLAVAINGTVEVFAIDRLQGKVGELQRSDLEGAYKCISEAHKANIVSLSISPDCSTLAATASDNKMSVFPCSIQDVSNRSIHDWYATIPDKSLISKLFFLDNYPELLHDSSARFWGSAFIGTRSGMMLLVDLSTWSIYKEQAISTDQTGPKNFDYRIDLSAHNIIAINGNQCFVVQLSFDKLPTIAKVTKLVLNNSAYSFVIKQCTKDELELFTISAYSLERHIINMNVIATIKDTPASDNVVEDSRLAGNTPHELKRFLQQFDGSLRISSSSNVANNAPNNDDSIILNTSVMTPMKQSEMDVLNMMSASMKRESSKKDKPLTSAGYSGPISNSSITSYNNKNNSPKICKGNSGSQPVSANLDIVQMDKMVEALFSKLNTAFSQGLDEFLADVKCEVNDLKLKLNGLCLEVRKLQLQLQEMDQK